MEAASCEVCLEISSEIKLIISTLKTLTTPPESGDKVIDISSSIENNIIKATALCGENKLKEWMKPMLSVCQDTEKPSWKLVCACLCCLLHLKNLNKTGNKNTLLSVTEKATIRSSLQFITALGILPFLMPGVGVPAPEQEKLLQVPEQIPEIEQHKKLFEIVKILLSLLKDKTWEPYGIIISTTLTDLIAAMIQLSWRPVIEGIPKTVFWKEIQRFRLVTGDFIYSLHQPTVIRELMFCLATDPSKKLIPPPVWFIIACTRCLTLCLLAPNGIISTVRALHDLGSIDDNKSKEYMCTAKLLIGPHGPNKGEYYFTLCPQLLILLKSENSEYKNVAILTAQFLRNKHGEIFKNQILKPLFDPICADYGELTGNLVLESSQEEKLSSSVSSLLALTSPAGIPVSDLTQYFENLCNFYLAIRRQGGTPQLRMKTRELLTQIVKDTEDDATWKQFLSLPEDCLIDLGSDSSLANVIFINVLKLLHTTQELEEKIQYCQILMSFSEMPSVQKQSLQKPTSLLINTIKSFIEDPDNEMASIALLLLGTMVAECEEWSQYQCLVPALQNLRKSVLLTESLRAVAEEIIATIATYGAMNMEKPSEAVQKSVLQSESKPETSKKPELLKDIPLKEALAEIQDSDIPVQGHGYLALTKLIKKKNSDILSSQKHIYDLCIKGIQHEDSYVYLAAVGALSALTLNSLDDVLPKVAADYCKPDHEPNLRTRLGETLLQTCKGLGEMAGKHRSTLLGTFLATCKDQSPAIRTSSLSNLGEACRVLGFQVSSQLQEILLCAHHLSTSDPEMEVRRAATMLVSLLLRGLGKDAVPQLGSSALELYRGMKQLALSDDPTLSLQAQLALEELSHGIKEGVFAPQPLEKNIFVLSPPP